MPDLSRGNRRAKALYGRVGGVSNKAMRQQFFRKNQQSQIQRVRAATRLANQYRRNARNKPVDKRPPVQDSISPAADSHGGNAAPLDPKRKLDSISKYVLQTILPERSSDTVRAPCPVNFKNHCTRFNQPTVLDIPASGKLAGRWLPTPSFLETTNSDPVTGSSEVTGAIDALGQGALTIDFGGTILGRVRARPYPDFGNKYFFPITIPAAGYFNFPEYAPDFIVGIKTSDNSIITFGPDGGSGSVFTCPSTIKAFTFDYSPLATATFNNVIVNPITIPPGALYDSTPIKIPNETQTLRATVLTGLLTYSGSTLNDGGSVVMALTDPGWYPLTDDLYTELSSLPDKRFNGPLKRGAYGWWTPPVFSESVPQPIQYYDSFPNTSALWFAIVGATPGVAVKLEGNIAIEFFDPNQVYSHVASPPNAPIHQHLMALFNNMPHVMPNDEHHDICSGLVSKAMGSVTAAIKDPIALGLGLLSLA